MNNQLRLGQAVANLCIETREDDGIAPRYLSKRDAGKKPSHKTLQLSKEAAHIIAMVLMGEIKHPQLANVQLVSVKPSLDGQLLAISVGQYPADVLLTEAEILAALSSAQSQIRWALAQGLHRKRTPLLKFCYAGVIGKGGF